MTELEKIQYARSFLEQMANGIDPLTGKPIPPSELLNHVRISRCLFYVSDLLRQIIENGGITPKKKQKKLPFILSYEKRQDFAFSDVPISVTEMVNRLNELIDANQMKKINTRQITEWLVEIGLLEIVIGEKERPAKRPTHQGEDMGILTEERWGQYGVYTVVLYNRTAQQFVLDNLDAVISLQHKQPEQ